MVRAPKFEPSFQCVWVSWCAHTPPSDWKQDTVNVIANKFWVRVHPASVTTPATIYNIQLNNVFLCIMLNPGFDETADDYNEITYTLTLLQQEFPWMGIVKKLSGTITRDDFNNLVAFLGGSSTNTSLFDTDLAMNNTSTCLIVVTPNGTKRYRIRVGNSGNLVTEQA